MLLADYDHIVINEYKSIISLSDCYIKVDIGKCYICIKGKNMSIEYYDYLEIRIKGELYNISYETRI